MKFAAWIGTLGTDDAVTIVSFFSQFEVFFSAVPSFLCFRFQLLFFFLVVVLSFLCNVRSINHEVTVRGHMFGNVILRDLFMVGGQNVGIVIELAAFDKSSAVMCTHFSICRQFEIEGWFWKFYISCPLKCHRDTLYRVPQCQIKRVENLIKMQWEGGTNRGYVEFS